MIDTDIFATSAQLSSCLFPLFSKININDMFSTLPKSLTMELAVACKVKDDQVEVGRRRKLVEDNTPTQVSCDWWTAGHMITILIPDWSSLATSARSPTFPSRLPSRTFSLAAKTLLKKTNPSGRTVRKLQKRESNHKK